MGGTAHATDDADPSRGLLAGTTAARATPTLTTPTLTTPTLTTLVSFVGSNGRNPRYDKLLIDAAGNLYGTTTGGGATYDGGTVFELSGTGFVVPEPATAAVLAVVLPIVLGRRRARR